MENEDATLIKSLHSDLRRKCQENSDNFLQIWNDHIQDEKRLKEYSQSMHRLAVDKWNSRRSGFQEADRIDWIYNTLIRFFIENDWKRFQNRLEKRSSIPNPDLKIYHGSESLKILDVGSCFNPFGNKKHLNTTAIDIAPAVDEVKKCDFINVQTSSSIEKEEFSNHEVIKLPENHYNGVIFSLLLEYLPVPQMRYRACVQAQKILKTNDGLLIIITPDSSHQGKNLKVMRSWRICLALLGFVRIYYEKLEHLHCMAFQKLDLNLFGDYLRNEANQEATKLGISLKDCDIIDLMIIPQDNKTRKDIAKEKEIQRKNAELNTNPETMVDLFDNLPNFE